MKQSHATVLAIFAAPIVPPATVGAIVAIFGHGVDGFLTYMALLLYFWSLIFAVCMLPIFLTLKRGGLVKWPVAFAAGCVPGSTAALLFNWRDAGQGSWLTACAGGVAGAGVAMTFWLIWRYWADEETQTAES